MKRIASAVIDTNGDQVPDTRVSGTSNFASGWSVVSGAIGLLLGAFNGVLSNAFGLPAPGFELVPIHGMADRSRGETALLLGGEIETQPVVERRGRLL